MEKRFPVCDCPDATQMHRDRWPMALNSNNDTTTTNDDNNNNNNTNTTNNNKQ